MRGAEPQLNAKILAGFDAALRSYPRLNVGSAQLLGEARIDPEAALKADQLPLNRIAELFEIAARHTGDECFGLHLARHLPPGATGSLGFVLSNAPDLRVFAICLARFINLRIDALSIEFTEEDGMARLAWTFGPELVVPHKQLTELLLAMFMDRVRFFMDETWQPAKAEFTYREPNSAGEYEAKFGRNLIFNAPVTRLMAPSASFRRPSSQANPSLFKKLHGIAEGELKALAASNDIVDRLGRARDRGAHRDRAGYRRRGRRARDPSRRDARAAGALGRRRLAQSGVRRGDWSHRRVLLWRGESPRGWRHLDLARGPAPHAQHRRHHRPR